MNIGQIVTPNSKGQIVIPWKIRRDLGIDETTSLQIMFTGQSIVIHPISDVVRRMGVNETFREILKRTAGAWGPVTREERKREERRRKMELEAARKRRNAW